MTQCSCPRKNQSKRKTRCCCHSLNLMMEDTQSNRKHMQKSYLHI
jgi:hypothetical protein